MPHLIPRGLLVAALVFASLATGSAQIQLRPGLYQTVHDMDFDGSKMSRKDDQCITAEDLKKDYLTLMMEEDEEKNCKISNYKMSGKSLTFNMTCVIEDLTMVSTVQIMFAGDSYTGVSQSKDNKGRTTTIKMAGKRVGDCTK